MEFLGNVSSRYYSHLRLLRLVFVLSLDSCISGKNEVVGKGQKWE